MKTVYCDMAVIRTCTSRREVLQLIFEKGESNSEKKFTRPSLTLHQPSDCPIDALRQHVEMTSISFIYCNRVAETTSLDPMRQQVVNHGVLLWLQVGVSHTAFSMSKCPE